MGFVDIYYVKKYNEAKGAVPNGTMGGDMEENYQEYVTFATKDKDGNDIEMAVVDEFEYSRKNYVVTAIVTGDEIAGDERFIYRVKPGTEFAVEKITVPGEYEEVANAYLEMED